MTAKDGNPLSLPEKVRKVVEDPQRLATLHELGAVEAGLDADFQALTNLARAIFEAPVALISLVDRDKQKFKASSGFEAVETSVDVSFCAHTIASKSPDIMVVTDTTKDRRFSRNPLVTGEPSIRFYVGAPIVVDGEKIGTVCVLDHRARPAPSPAQKRQLADLAGLTANLLVLKERTRRGQKAQQDLSRVEKRHALALKAASIASWVWDIPSGIIECDELMPKLFDLPAATRIAASDIFRSVDPRDARQTEDRLREALAGEEDYAGEFRLRRSNPPRWLAGRGRVVERDDRGRPLLVIGVNFEITEQKSAEERQRLLLRELNHRVKNTLATVQALASQTIRHAKRPADFLEGFGSRLQALGLAHNLLTERGWRDIELGELVRLEVMPFLTDEEHRIEVRGARVFLSPDQAVAIGLILHELADNAIKYGALSGTEGKVELSWNVGKSEEGERLGVVWQERGGPAVSPPERPGFGSILIQRSLGKVLSSGVSHVFAPEGVRAEISLPLGDD